VSNGPGYPRGIAGVQHHPINNMSRMPFTPDCHRFWFAPWFLIEHDKKFYIGGAGEPPPGALGTSVFNTREEAENVIRMINRAYSRGHNDAQGKFREALGFV